MRALRLVSLRARLLVGLVVLAAIGLLVAGFVTYRAERAFLFDQLDSQLVSSARAIEDQVDVNAGLRPAPLAATQNADPDDNDGGTPGHPAMPQESISDPPGTFGEHLNASDQRIGEPTAIGYSSSYPPKLPANFAITANNLMHPQFFTVPAAGDRGLSYRVIAKRSDVGYGTTIVAIPVNGVDASLARLETIEAIVIASVLVALAILAWFVIRIGLRPLDRIGATAGAIAAGDLSRRVSPEDDRTEVGRLGLALNAMLGQIEQAFARRQESEERLRRFLSDASHELRTPLTSIRGYAELFRRGATTSPEDTAKAMQRIEEEASRMGILVEQLLALARLDEMPQTVREPVDLAPLVRDAADDTRAVAQDRTIGVTIVPQVRGSRSAHMVNGDGHELRQVLANLMTNALKHTPAGSPIELSLRSKGGVARIEVRDHGPGLPEDASDAVFERFWRSEGGRERGKAGAGLGLSIVAEIVEANAGRVSAGNAKDGGAAFVIELPLAEQKPPRRATKKAVRPTRRDS